jgi:hypothetical protein
MNGAIAGVVLGITTIVFARMIRGESWVYAIGLLTLPSLYALFGLRAGDYTVSARELIYGIPYIASGLLFASVSIRHSGVIVGVLWILHGLYDLIHGRLIMNAGVPAWYPAFCFSVDIVIGAYVLWLSRRIPNASLQRAPDM